MLFYFPFPAIVRLTVASVAGGNNRVLHKQKDQCPVGHGKTLARTTIGTTSCMEFFRITTILSTDMSPVKQAISRNRAKQEWENPLGRESQFFYPCPVIREGG